MRDVVSGRAKLFLVVIAFGSLPALCAAQASSRPAYRWTKFVQVEGQPEPVPAEWVATPEGKFAHSIRIPNPVPKDSGYRKGMTSEQYFNHLCKTEAGEFIYRTAENVEGFYFMRPPKRPTDDDLMDRYKLEDPYTERYYQLIPDRAPDRHTQFVNPPFNQYMYVEEPRRAVSWQASVRTPFVRASGYRFDSKQWKVVAEMKISEVDAPKSRFGYTWRGLRRDRDRDNAIAGSELLVIDLRSNEILGVLRNFAMSPSMRNVSDGIWWLNAISCRQFPASYRDNLGKQIYLFVSKVLKPVGIGEGGQHADAN